MAQSSELTRGSNPMHLSVSNFGPISEAEIELRPLTVFAGPSNTGKSYLAILIYALHRIFNGSSHNPQAPFNRRHLRRDYYTSPFHRQHRLRGDRKLSKNDSSNIVKWATELSANKKQREILPTSISSMVYRELTEGQYSEDAIFPEIVRCFGVNATRDLIRHSARNTTISVNKQIPNSKEPFEFNMKMSRSSNIIEPIFPAKSKLQLNNEGYFHWNNVIADIERFNRFDDLESHEYDVRFLLNSIANNVFAGIIYPLYLSSHYLPAGRTGVAEASHAIQAALYSRISRAGTEPINVPLLSGIIADFLPKMDPDFLSNSRLASRTLRKHADIMEKEVVGGKILIKDMEDNNSLSFYFSNSGSDEAVPLTVASSMVTELAPIVLHLRYIISDSDVLIIEEPESHLHPAKQVEFTRQLAFLVKEGVRVIITTHSEWVLEALTNIVQISDLPNAKRNGLPSSKFDLTPDQVGVWLFRNKKNSKGSTVEPININSKSDAFPADYDDVMDALYNEWSETANRKGE